MRALRTFWSKEKDEEMALKFKPVARVTCPVCGKFSQYMGMTGEYKHTRKKRKGENPRGISFTTYCKVKK